MAGASAVSRMSRQDMARLAEGAQEEDGEEDMAFIFNSRQIHYARLILKSRQMPKPTLPRLPDRVDTILEQWARERPDLEDRKSTRLNSSHLVISYAVFCLKKKKSIILLLLLDARVSAWSTSRRQSTDAAQVHAHGTQIAARVGVPLTILAVDYIHLGDACR